MLGLCQALSKWYLLSLEGRNLLPRGQVADVTVGLGEAGRDRSPPADLGLPQWQGFY